MMTFYPHHGISGSRIEFLGRMVRKSASPGGEAKLKAQHDHLCQLNHCLPSCCVEIYEWSGNAYTMAFCPGVTFDVYCTMTTQRIAFQRLKEIVTTLWNNLYCHHDQRLDLEAYIDYLLLRTAAYGRLGPHVETLERLLTRLFDRLDGTTPLERARSGLIHGDLTFENIIVTADAFALIDSNPPPGFNGTMTMDFGKLRQSIFSLYELEKFDGSRARSGLRSTYTYIADRFAYLFPRWGMALDLQARFYEASHYIRLLTYKHRRSPKMAMEYYRMAVDVLEGVLADLHDDSMHPSWRERVHL